WDSMRLRTKRTYSTMEDFLVTYVEGHFLGGGPIFHERDANDLLDMLWTWQYGDVGATPGFDGDHVKALRSIKARLIAMPAERDMYFPPADEDYASQLIEKGEVRRIPGVWAHFAVHGDNPVDSSIIDDVLKELLKGKGGLV